MKQQIVSRYDSAVVLFECEVPDEMPSCMAVRHALEHAVRAGADLTSADLSGANLSGAYLTSAKLSGAYLARAKLSPSITISSRPLQLYGLEWDVTIWDAHMQIGCQFHSLHEWQSFDDAKIAAMDGRNALRFWRAHKELLLGMARADGRSFDEQDAAE